MSPYYIHITVSYPYIPVLTFKRITWLRIVCEFASVILSFTVRFYDTLLPLYHSITELIIPGYDDDHRIDKQRGILLNYTLTMGGT